MTDDPHATLSSHGYRGHTCLFCGVPIPPDDAQELTLTISRPDKTPRFWAHRRCVYEAIHPSVRQTIEREAADVRLDIFPPPA